MGMNNSVLIGKNANMSGSSVVGRGEIEHEDRKREKVKDKPSMNSLELKMISSPTKWRHQIYEKNEN